MFAKTRLALAAPLALMIAACTPAADKDAGADAAPTMAAETAAAAPSYAAWVGKWTGPEGLYVTIADAGEGRYTLQMQSDLETNATYAGTATPDGIAFERGGEKRLLKKATGDETGLKWFAGKQDCLMVQEGEGFCRD